VRWLADECVDAGLVFRLRGAGHDVVYIAEVASGATDVEVIRRAHNEGRLLLTEDKDFGELVFRGRTAVPGLVLLRILSEGRPIKWMRLEAAVEQFGDRLLGRYVVIEEGRFRSRPLLKSIPFGGPPS
jgi:predicted nuclease of predicted toxin-antitoxin system